MTQQGLRGTLAAAVLLLAAVAGQAAFASFSLSTDPSDRDGGAETRLVVLAVVLLLVAVLVAWQGPRLSAVLTALGAGLWLVLGLFGWFLSLPLLLTAVVLLLLLARGR